MFIFPRFTPTPTLARAKSGEDKSAGSKKEISILFKGLLGTFKSDWDYELTKYFRSMVDLFRWLSKTYDIYILYYKDGKQTKITIFDDYL